MVRNTKHFATCYSHFLKHQMRAEKRDNNKCGTVQCRNKDLFVKIRTRIELKLLLFLYEFL